MKRKLLITAIFVIAITCGVIAIIMLRGGNDVASASRFDGVSFSGKSFVYDGEPKTITVEGAPEGTRIVYIGGNSFTEVGVYTVTALLSKEGYKDKTLSALLTITEPQAVIYTVSFDTEGIFPVQPQNAESGKPIAPPQIPDRKGYTLLGWYDGDERFEFTTDTVTGDTLLKAKWELTEYTVTYHLSGGLNHSDNPTSVNVKDGSIKLHEPTRNDYLFLGWYTDSRYLETKRVETVSAEEYSDINLYAKWKPLSYTVSFNTEGGSVIDPLTVEGNSTLTAPKAPEKRGYEFVCWKNKGEVWSFANNKVTENMTLSAVWKVAEYSVTLHLRGGALQGGAIPESYTAFDTAITLPTPSKEGYTFEGWYLNEAMTSSKKVTEIAGGEIGNIELYVKWNAIPYSVVFLTDGGEFEGEPKSTYTADDGDYLLPTPFKLGYAFAGWFTDESFSDEPVDKIEAGSFGNLRFYAKWIKCYTVSVFSLRGTPIGNVKVSLLDENGNIAATAFTDEATGLAEFKEITDGSYTISLELDGTPLKAMNSETLSEDKPTVAIMIT